MGGVAQELDAAAAPAFGGFTAEQTELVASLDLTHQRVQALAGERREFGADKVRVVQRGPGFLGPVVALAAQHDVDQLAAAQEIADAIMIRAHPAARAGSAENIGRQVFALKQRPPGDLPGEHRIFVVPQGGANPRADAVGADHHVGFDLLAVFQRDRCGGVGGRHADAARAEMDDRFRHRALQHAEQIGAVELILRLAVARLELAPGKAEQPRVGLHVAHRQFAADVAEPPRLVAETEGVEHFRAVRRDVDAGADLAERRRLLVDLDLKALLPQTDRGGQSAQTRSDDDDPACLRHSCILGW